MKNNNVLSHSDNNDDKRQQNASFVRKNLTKEELKIRKQKIEIEKQRKKIENLIEKKLIEADKKEEKQKKLALKNKEDDKSSSKDISNIPAISLKEFNSKKETRVKKESFLSKFLKKIQDKKDEMLKEQAEKKRQQEEMHKAEKEAKIKVQEEEKNRIIAEKEAKVRAQEEEKNRVIAEKEAKVRAQEEEKNRIIAEKEAKVRAQEEEKNRVIAEKEAKVRAQEEEKNRIIAEKEAKIKAREEEKNRIKAEKEAKIKAREEEKNRIKAEKEAKRNKIISEKEAKKRAIAEEKRLKVQAEEEAKLRKKSEEDILSTTVTTNGGVLQDKKLLKAQRKENREKEKALLKQKKEEERKKKLQEKFEQQAKAKKEKEDKAILLLNEKREKNKKIKKEKEQARRERKEKALLIKKAQEESKQKARSERKTLNEKISNWYNNLSIVKDRKNRRELQRQTLLIDFDGADAIRSDEKIMYKYVAKNSETGKVETGYFAAFSKLDVHSFLMAEGYEVYEITPQKNFAKTLTLFSPKFKATELDFFLTQLSTFLKSGMTLVESVKILSKQSKKSGHKNVYKSIIYELTMGENFSEALAKQGNIFPRLLINMVKTSELTGDLPETLDDMASYYRDTDKTRKQMISAISYPAAVLLFALGILIFIMVKVIPQFVSIYSNMETGVPGITQKIINISAFLQSNWLKVLLGFLVFVIVFIILFKNIKVFKSIVQTFVMNLPIIGKIIIYNEVTMFTKTFASLLNHNVYITDSMEVLSKITNNEIYKMLIFDTITNLAKGEAISNSFKNHWAFPNIAYEMILTGEKTGQLGTMMDKVANYYGEQHKNAVNQIKAFIEPVMIIILAAIVGVILLSIVVPMFDMYQNISAM
ncbi:MAG: type II secretion system F family protein [Bacilli bacterium]|nr:type II secretion system F family protein [Bacilli bacterium]